MRSNYVHGYDERENSRLQDQATTLVELLHSDSIFPLGSLILEVGCGVGAQTITLAGKNPNSCFVSIDISKDSLSSAKKKMELEEISNVHFQQANIFNLPFKPHSFDHIFVCFVLEHLANPVDVLKILKGFIKPNGTITVIEGDHGSTFFYPDSKAAHKAISCQVELQKRSGGNAMIGRELYPLLIKAGYVNVTVSPRMVYVDSSKPELADGFTRKTFTAMIEGIRYSAIEAGLINSTDFDKGINDLYRSAESDGVFCYTFFKAIAVNK